MSNSQFTGSAAERNPPARAIPQIPECSENLFLARGQPCHTFLYTPAGDPTIERLVAMVRETNDPPISKDKVLGLGQPGEVSMRLDASRPSLTDEHAGRQVSAWTPSNSLGCRASVQRLVRKSGAKKSYTSNLGCNLNAPHPAVCKSSRPSATSFRQTARLYTSRASFRIPLCTFKCLCRLVMPFLNASSKLVTILSYWYTGCV